jgi:hypothetical protein
MGIGEAEVSPSNFMLAAKHVFLPNQIRPPPTGNLND